MRFAWVLFAAGESEGGGAASVGCEYFTVEEGAREDLFLVEDNTKDCDGGGWVDTCAEEGEVFEGVIFLIEEGVG